MDHHFLRDKFHIKRLLECYNHAKDVGINLCNAAEYLDKDSLLLEAYRKELYKGSTEEEIISAHKSYKKDLLG